jgi:hypothetical protein
MKLKLMLIAAASMGIASAIPASAQTTEGDVVAAVQTAEVKPPFKETREAKKYFDQRAQIMLRLKPETFLPSWEKRHAKRYANAVRAIPLIVKEDIGFARIVADDYRKKLKGGFAKIESALSIGEIFKLVSPNDVYLTDYASEGEIAALAGEKSLFPALISAAKRLQKKQLEEGIYKAQRGIGQTSNVYVAWLEQQSRLLPTAEAIVLIELEVATLKKVAPEHWAIERLATILELLKDLSQEEGK